jgi:outer membrane protein OmpA-like peptidoglycan-associated protein
VCPDPHNTRFIKQSTHGISMKKLTALVLALFASSAGAQEQFTPEGSLLSPKGAWELGIYPMTRNVTTDIGRRNKWGHGFTALAGYHFSDVFSLEGAMTGGWIPQANRRTDFSVNFLSPSLSLVYQPMITRKWAPYVLGGLSYEVYEFQNLAENADLREQNFASGHVGAGLRYRVAHNSALRMELNAEVGNARPTVGAFLGLSFLPGARRPTPATRTITQLRTDTLRIEQAPRVDTLRITQVQRDTVFRSEVLLSLNDVNFDFDQATLRPEARPILDNAATTINSGTWATLQIAVVGFTDSRGSDDYNIRLGMRRAKTVADYLVSKGVSAARVSVLSGGEGSPVADNNTDAGRAQNRRVVIMRGGNR